MKRHRISIIAVTLFVAAAILILPAASQAEVISFNLLRGWVYPDNEFLVSPQANGMASEETAGAPGVNVANWNNVFSDHREDDLLTPEPPTGLSNNETSGPYAGDFVAAYGQPMDDAGVVQTGMGVTWYLRGSVGAGGGGVDDARMFSSNWDNWGRSGDTAGSPDLGADGTDAKITVTGIPYAQYDVYVYARRGSETWSTNGGTYYANGIAKGLSLTQVADGVYVEVPTDGPYDNDNADDWDGTYVHFTDLSGDLTLIMDATTDGGQRMPTSGFQIVEVPLTVLLGDADDNGVVDAADYVALKANIGQSTGATTADGDFDGDGDVDWHDMQTLQDHFGETNASPMVPEPASAMLLMFGAAALLRRRLRR